MAGAMRAGGRAGVRPEADLDAGAPAIQELYDVRSDTRCVLTNPSRVVKGLNDSSSAGVFLITWSHAHMAQISSPPRVRVMGHFRDPAAAADYMFQCKTLLPRMSTLLVHGLRPVLIAQSMDRVAPREGAEAARNLAAAAAKVEAIIARNTARLIEDQGTVVEDAAAARRLNTNLNKPAADAPAAAANGLITSKEAYTEYRKAAMAQAGALMDITLDEDEEEAAAAAAPAAPAAAGEEEAKEEGGGKAAAAAAAEGEDAGELIPGISTIHADLASIVRDQKWVLVAILLDEDPAAQEHVVWFLNTFSTLDDLYAWNKKHKRDMARYTLYPVRMWEWWDPVKRVHAKTKGIYTNSGKQQLYDSLDARTEMMSQVLSEEQVADMTRSQAASESKTTVAVDRVAEDDATLAEAHAAMAAFRARMAKTRE